MFFLLLLLFGLTPWPSLMHLEKRLCVTPSQPVFEAFWGPNFLPEKKSSPKNRGKLLRKITFCFWSLQVYFWAHNMFCQACC